MSYVKFSDYIVSIVIENNTNNIPIYIYYDSSISETLYYSLLINNKLLIKDKLLNVILFDLAIDNTVITSRLNTTCQKIIIIDCVFELKVLINYIRSNNLLSNIANIYTYLNYYNTSIIDLKDDFLIYYLCIFINIINAERLKLYSHNYETKYSYRELCKNDLIYQLVKSDEKSLSKYVEILNTYILHKYDSFYRIYFICNFHGEIIKYINLWEILDPLLISYINSFNTFDYLTKYNIINDTSFIYSNIKKMTPLYYLFIKFPIVYFSSVDEKIFINRFEIINSNDHFKSDYKIKLKSNLIYKTDQLSDSIYKITGNSFMPNISYENNAIIIKTSDSVNMIDLSKTNIFDLNINMYISESGEIYHLFILSNLKFNQFIYNEPDVDQIDISLIDNYYIFVLILSKHQYRLLRYVLIDNKMKLDEKLEINPWYNNIQSSNYMSKLYFNNMDLLYNIMY